MTGEFMDTQRLVTLVIDILPFVIYTALLVKILTSWFALKHIEQKARSGLAAILLLASVVIVLFIASNVYALAMYGKTFLSIRVFQMFVVGNCVVYWLLIEYVIRSIRGQVAKEATREPAN